MGREVFVKYLLATFSSLLVNVPHYRYLLSLSCYSVPRGSASVTEKLLCYQFLPPHNPTLPRQVSAPFRATPPCLQIKNIGQDQL